MARVRVSVPAECVAQPAAVLHGARLPLTDAGSKMLLFMLHDREGCDAWVTPERFGSEARDRPVITSLSIGRPTRAAPRSLPRCGGTRRTERTPGASRRSRTDPIRLRPPCIGEDRPGRSGSTWTSRWCAGSSSAVGRVGSIDDLRNGAPGFQNDGDNELTGLVISDGDPATRCIRGAKRPQPFHRGSRVSFTQQHGDNTTWEILPCPARWR